MGHPNRIWIDMEHGKHPEDWNFYTEDVVPAGDHIKAKRVPYVPQGADGAKWQKKAALQAQEIKDLRRNLEATQDNLKDVIAQRNGMRDFVREVAKADEGECGMCGTVRGLAKSAAHLLVPFKHKA